MWWYSLKYGTDPSCASWELQGCISFCEDSALFFFVYSYVLSGALISFSHGLIGVERDVKDLIATFAMGKDQVAQSPI